MKEQGADNDLLERIAADPVFGITREEIDELLRTDSFTGMAAEQTEDYLRDVRRLLDDNSSFLGEREKGTINV